MADFFEHWFKGWEEALENMPKAEQGKMLGACGRDTQSAAVTYTRKGM